MSLLAGIKQEFWTYFQDGSCKVMCDNSLEVAIVAVLEIINLHTVE